MKKCAILLLGLLLGGCTQWHRLIGTDTTSTPPAATPWLAITGTWNGTYSTDKIQNVRITIWIDFMKLYDNHFTGTMNDGQTGGMDGSSTSQFAGTVDPSNNTFVFTVHSGDPTCGGTFIVGGDVIVSPKGPTALVFKTISGSNCLGNHTTIAGTLN